MKQIWMGLFALGLVLAQTTVDLGNQSKNVNFAQAVATTPWKVGAALPATCSVGAAFYNTAATAGANVFVCTATNTWTLASGGGSDLNFTSGSGAPAGSCAPGAFYLDTAAQDIWICDSSNAWKKALTTNNTGAFRITGQAGTAPATPAAGSASLYFSSTAKVGQTIDDTGALATMVRPSDCSGAGQFVQTIAATGTAACATPVTTVSRSFAPVGGASGAPSSLWFHDGQTPQCDGTGGLRCYLRWFENGSTNNIAIFNDVIPVGLTSGGVQITLRYVGTGSSIQWSVATACQGNAAADPPTFNAAQNLAATSTSAGLVYATTLTAVTTTGCSAGNAIYFRIRRVDATGFVNLTAASVRYTLQ